MNVACTTDGGPVQPCKKACRALPLCYIDRPMNPVQTTRRPTSNAAGAVRVFGLLALLLPTTG